MLVDVYNKASYSNISHVSRLVKKESKGPFEIKVGTDSIWICMCGLSNNQPLCDDSHMKTIDEDNKTYVYDKEGQRIEVKSTQE